MSRQKFTYINGILELIEGVDPPEYFISDRLVNRDMFVSQIRDNIMPILRGKTYESREDFFDIIGLLGVDINDINGLIEEKLMTLINIETLMALKLNNPELNFNAMNFLNKLENNIRTHTFKNNDDHVYTQFIFLCNCYDKLTNFATQYLKI